MPSQTAPGNSTRDQTAATQSATPESNQSGETVHVPGVMREITKKGRVLYQLKSPGPRPPPPPPTEEELKLKRDIKTFLENKRTLNKSVKRKHGDEDDHDTSATPPELPKKKLCKVTDVRSKCGTATIIVRCGTDTTEDFTVHENLITAASKFFKAALSHDWKEKFDRLIKLLDILPDDFRLYVRWLYTNSLFPSARADIDTINVMSQAGLGQFQPREDELTATIDAIITILPTIGHLEIGTVLQHLIEPLELYTPDGSPSRAFPFDAMLAKWSPEQYLGLLTYKGEGSELIKGAFWAQVVNALVGWQDEGGTFGSRPALQLEKSCMYHGHGEEECYRTSR